MDYMGTEVSTKIRAAIRAKLRELGGGFMDEELPDYVMVMVANKRSHKQMEEDLSLFLGDNTEEFTSWLYQVLHKLREVTVVAGKEPHHLPTTGNNRLASTVTSVKKSSEPTAAFKMEVSQSVGLKRKSSTTDKDEEEYRKEKRTKLSEVKKVRKSSESDKAKVQCNESENSKRNCDSIVIKDKTVKSLIVNKEICNKVVDKVCKMDRSDKSHDDKSSNVACKMNSSLSSKIELVERISSEYCRLPNSVYAPDNQETTTDKSTPLSEEKLQEDTKLKNCIGVTNQQNKAKIVFYQSDYDDEEEDCINIKADAEAEALLKAELPKEVLEPQIFVMATTPVEPVVETSKEDENKLEPLNKTIDKKCVQVAEVVCEKLEKHSKIKEKKKHKKKHTEIKTHITTKKLNDAEDKSLKKVGHHHKSRSKRHSRSPNRKFSKDQSDGRRLSEENTESKGKPDLQLCSKQRETDKSDRTKALGETVETKEKNSPNSIVDAVFGGKQSESTLKSPLEQKSAFSSHSAVVSVPVKERLGMKVPQVLSQSRLNKVRVVRCDKIWREAVVSSSGVK